MDSQTVHVGALRTLVVVVSALLIAGSLISYDKAAAQMFGLLGGVFLPLIALLYETAL